MKTVLGFDLGGTKSAIGLYNADTWQELRHVSMPTEASRGFAAVYASALSLIRDLRDSDTTAIGFGVAGLVRQPQGIIHHCPNIPGADAFALKDRLAADTGLPVAVENDARCFTLAEAVLGAGKGRKTVVGITMGTGVGGGITVDGVLQHGEHGFAGEIGHMLLRPGEPPYPTQDMRGDAEQFFSGTAMGKRCEAAQKPEEYLEGQACSFLHPFLFREIAWMAVSITHLVDPSVIVFGGSAGLALKGHLDEIRLEMAKWILPGTPLPDIALAQTSHSGALGAAVLARRL